MFGANTMLTGLAVGAGAMYFCDATHGTRRRKLLADQFNHLMHRAADDFDTSWRDLTNRACGTVAQARSRLRSGEAPDDVICSRVRSTMGHVISNPPEIEVDSSFGHVVLRGPIARTELAPLLAAVGMVSGVRTVTDELVVRDTEQPGQEASQAGSQQQQPTLPAPLRALQGNWSPGTKLLLGTLGGVMMANCLLSRHRRVTDLALCAVGAGLVTKSLATRNVGTRSGQQVEFHKTVEIHAPIEKVFDFFTKPENLPTISSRVRNVRMQEGGRITKAVGLPGGMSVHLAERITCLKPEECWMSQSEPDSMLQYAKQMNFTTDDDRTRVHLHFQYSPPGGTLGHTAAAAFGLDAKSFFDDIMMRAKTYLETGIPPHDAARRSQQHTGGQQAGSSTEGSPAEPATQGSTGLAGGERQETQAPSIGVVQAAPTDQGANVPPHDAAPDVAGMAETDQIGPLDRDIAEGTEAEQAAMRNHI
jgi:uncharacterized membrane protein